MTIFAKIYLKSTVMACLFVSQTFAATALVEKYDRYRREAYNAKGLNEVVPGYTVKLKNIFRSIPAKRQADYQEKETILKAVIATALIHDDNMPLFDSVGDAIPDFTHRDGGIRSHFKILWHAEHFARNSIRTVLEKYGEQLQNEYSRRIQSGFGINGALENVQEETNANARQIIADSYAEDNDLHQLESLSGIQADDFTRWVSEVYTDYRKGLYRDVDVPSWRKSRAYEKDFTDYESLADKHYGQFEALKAYTRPDSRSASASSATASKSAYGYRVKGQPKVEVVGEFAYGYQVMDQPKVEVVGESHANKKLPASETAFAPTAVPEMRTTSKPLSRPSDRASISAAQQPARQTAAATYVPKSVSSASITSGSLPAPSALVEALNYAVVDRSFNDSLLLNTALTLFHDHATDDSVKLEVTKYLMRVIKDASEEAALRVAEAIADKYKIENQYDKLFSLVEIFCKRQELLQSPLMQEIANFILKNKGKMQNKECENGLRYILYVADKFPDLFVAQKKAALDFMKRKLAHDTELDSSDVYGYAELLFEEGNLEDRISCVNAFLKQAESCDEDDAFNTPYGHITRVRNILNYSEARLENHMGASGAVFDARGVMYEFLGEYYEKLTRVLCIRAGKARLFSEEKRKVEEMLDRLQSRTFYDQNMKTAIAIVIAGNYLDSNIGLNAAQYLLRPGIKKPGTEFPTDSSMRNSLIQLLERKDLNETIRSRATKLLGRNEEADRHSLASYGR